MRRNAFVLQLAGDHGPDRFVVRLRFGPEFLHALRKFGKAGIHTVETGRQIIQSCIFFLFIL